MAKPPKLAGISSLADFSHWLADTVQRAAAQENAGFVQIVREYESLIVVSTGTAVFRCTLAAEVSDAA